MGGSAIDSAERPWLARYDHGVPPTLEYPAIRLDGLLRRAADHYPDLTASVFFGRRTAYAELDAAVDRIAGGLRRLGLAPGARIALFLPNCPQLVEGLEAVWRAGHVAVPVNPRTSGPELVALLTDSGAQVLVALDRLWNRLGSVDLPGSVRAVFIADLADSLPLPMRFGARLAGRRGSPNPPAASATQDVLPFRDLCRADPVDRDRASAGPDDPAVLLPTGGTTGLPKLAVLSHRNLVANACQLGAWAASLNEGDEVMLSALPLAHGYAMTACLNVSILRGWTQVLVPDPRNIPSVLDAIEHERVTVFPGVPTLYAAICADPGVRAGRRDLRSVEICISGAATLPSAVQAEFERLTGGRLVEGYGLTEASPATHCNPLDGHERTEGIGLPLPDTDCRLVDLDAERRLVGPGEPGVLCIRGPQVMAGYWHRPEDTALALRPDEDGRTWLHTGDIAVASVDGFFRIIDRKKDVIVAAGGLKVYPAEVEDVLSTHPKVRLAAVVGVPPGGSDQRAKAFVVPRDGDPPDPDEILAFLRQRLAPHKVPRAVELRPDLPLAFTGKVLRRVLAEEDSVAPVAADTS